MEAACGVSVASAWRCCALHADQAYCRCRADHPRALTYDGEPGTRAGAMQFGLLGHSNWPATRERASSSSEGAGRRCWELGAFVRTPRCHRARDPFRRLGACGGAASCPGSLRSPRRRAGHLIGVSIAALGAASTPVVIISSHTAVDPTAVYLLLLPLLIAVLAASHGGALDSALVSRIGTGLVLACCSAASALDRGCGRGLCAARGVRPVGGDARRAAGREARDASRGDVGSAGGPRQRIRRRGVGRWTGHPPRVSGRPPRKPGRITGSVSPSPARSSARSAPYRPLSGRSAKHTGPMRLGTPSATCALGRPVHRDPAHTGDRGGDHIGRQRDPAMVGAPTAPVTPPTPPPQH